ncbi:MAG: hypothetical protein ACK5JO_01870 [Halodesulfovibrio sp.]
MNDITEQDARRFRMALLRAKLTRLAVTFEEDADEAMLERLVAYAERQRLKAGAGSEAPAEACSALSPETRSEAGPEANSEAGAECSGTAGDGGCCRKCSSGRNTEAAYQCRAQRREA